MKTARFTVVAVAAIAAAIWSGSAAAAEGGKRGAKAAEESKRVPASETAWQPIDPKKPDGPQIAVLWGKAEKAPYGFLLKVKAGVMLPRHSHTYSYDATVLQGEWKHTFTDETDAPALPAGSHWHQVGKQVHGDGCAAATGECIILVSYPAGKRDFIPAPEAKKAM
jgi:anti-sigma factor ChrR (cupin superfamily)